MKVKLLTAFIAISSLYGFAQPKGQKPKVMVVPEEAFL